MSSKLIIVFLLILVYTVMARKTGIPDRHAIKTIRVTNGDIVDCVDIYKQSAFDHPALKNHTIQMKSTHLQSTEDTPRTLRNSSSSKAQLQLWRQYGSCPNGTIPIRRSSYKHPTPGKVIVNKDHSFAVAATMGYSYSGAKANIKVFNPFIESIGAYSSSQVMLRAGPLQIFETAEAGWAVNPIVYNDHNTRLFAYWTVDGMQHTGCFDLTCPGFVQTSHEVTLGMDIGSFYASEITIQISKDPHTSNWWLKFNDKEIGYWPADIFETMKHQAVLVQWGGEVYSPKVGTSPHTATAMGSGAFADPITETSGKIIGMLVEQNSNPLKRPEPLYARSDEWNCYDAFILKEYLPEPILYYGGPGRRNNPKCS